MSKINVGALLDEISVEEALKICFKYGSYEDKVIALIQALFIIKPRKAIRWKFIKEVKNVKS